MGYKTSLLIFRAATFFYSRGLFSSFKDLELDIRILWVKEQSGDLDIVELIEMKHRLLSEKEESGQREL